MFLHYDRYVLSKNPFYIRDKTFSWEICIIIQYSATLFKLNPRKFLTPSYILNPLTSRAQSSTFFSFSWSKYFVKIYLILYIKGEKCTSLHSHEHVTMQLFKRCKSSVSPLPFIMLLACITHILWHTFR